MYNKCTIEPQFVKPLIAILYNPVYKKLYSKAIDEIENRYGLIDFVSHDFLFNMTDYYCSEMGNSLNRKIISLEQLVSPEILAIFKQTTNSIEDSLRINDMRKINLDCGYLDFYKLVLASIKFGGQKIYLKDGVYADIIAYYNKGNFEPFFWTFPDFKDGRYNSVLVKIRNIYKKQIAGLNINAGDKES